MTRYDFTPLAEFVEARYAPAREWGREVVLNYICWAAENNFLFIARNRDESIAGAALARPVSKFPETETEFDRSGHIAHIDFMVSDDKVAFLSLGLTILNTFNECSLVTFQRYKRGGSKKQYSASHVRQTLIKCRH